jgi:hypothetical protein
MAARYGAETPVFEWRERLVCSRCGGREVDMVMSSRTSAAVSSSDRVKVHGPYMGAWSEMAGLLASKSLILGVCKPLPPGPAFAIRGAARGYRAWPFRRGSGAQARPQTQADAPHQIREAIRQRDHEGGPVREIARSYNVSAATISRLTA